MSGLVESINRKCYFTTNEDGQVWCSVSVGGYVVAQYVDDGFEVVYYGMYAINLGANGTIYADSIIINRMYGFGTLVNGVEMHGEITAKERSKLIIGRK